MSNAGKDLFRHEVAAASDATSPPMGMSSLSDGFSDSYAGVRNLGLPVTSLSDAIQTDQSETFGLRARRRARALAFGIFALAAVPRLVVILFVTGPSYSGVGWYLDTLHHWQIAYLSKEIGFSHGFLRLWDFKGLEYFWGLVHPLATAALFSLTGSIDVLVPRILGLVTGSLATLFVFLLVRRYFGLAPALGSAAFMAVNPVVMVADTAGIQEPIGLMLLFGSLLQWPKRPIPSGILLGMAGMVRAEYWVFGLGLGAISFVVDRREYKNLALLLGWALASGAYAKYLFTYTGNPIYPVYWYFRGDAVGEWIGQDPLNSIEITVTYLSRALLPVFSIAALAVIRKKPKYALFALLGLGEMIFLSLVFGFSAYVNGFTYRILFDRVFVIPHIFLGILASVLLFHKPNPRKSRDLPKGGVALATAALLVANQALWAGLWHHHSKWGDFWSAQYQAASAIADVYPGGVVSIPEDRPDYTYFLSRYFEIPAHSIQGQMYDAFAYIDGDPFADYPSTEPLLLNWLTQNDIRLLVTYVSNQNYQEMIRRSPHWFTMAGTLLDGSIQMYFVHPANPSSARPSDGEG